MPLSFTPISDGKNWRGATWTIEDETQLAELVARVALGQSATVQRILKDLGEASAHPTSGFEGARSILTVTSEWDIAHRDGWVFQVIAWISAHKQYDHALIRSPQILRADKGFDGLIIEFGEGGVARIVICEEKATSKPRDMIRDKVWPEFEEIETGARDNQLVAGTSLMLALHGDKNPDATVADVLWNEQRAYRVSITVGETHHSNIGRVSLFKGYQEKVSGDVGRRRAETLYLDDLRKWLSSISDKALAFIDEAETASKAEDVDV